MWKTASASPLAGGRPRLVADHTHKEPCTKIARAGPCSCLPIRKRNFSFAPQKLENTFVALCSVVRAFFAFGPAGGWRNVSSVDLSPHPTEGDPLWMVTAVKA